MRRVVLTTLFILIAGTAAAAVVMFVQDRTATATMPMRDAVQSELMRESVRIDPDSLETLNSNCITRDYTIKLLGRILELQEQGAAPAERVRRGRGLLGGIERCMNRGVDLDRVPMGRWVIASRTVDVKDPAMYEKLMSDASLWDAEYEPADTYISDWLLPLKDGTPTRSKLTDLERLHEKHPDQKNVTYNLFRLYIALREYDSFRRLMREPHVRRLMVLEKHNTLLYPYWDFETLAAAQTTPRSRYLRAAFYFLHGDVDNAEAECAAALEIYPDSAPFHFLRALALHGQGRQALSEEAAARAVELDPANPVYKKALGIITGDFERPRLKRPVVLCYHRVTNDYLLETGVVTPQALESHLKFVSDEGLADARVCAPAAQKPAPGVPSVGFTFDDGYPDTGDTAWPLLDKYGFSGAVFVIAARVFGGYQSMDIPALRGLGAKGMRVGLHTMHHTRLKGADSGTLGLEINVAKWLLERHLGAPVNCFAYPYGAHSPEAEKRLRAAGFTETYALNNAPEGHTPERRIPILRADSLFLFKVKIYDLDYDGWIAAIQNQAP